MTERDNPDPPLDEGDKRAKLLSYTVQAVADGLIQALPKDIQFVVVIGDSVTTRIEVAGSMELEGMTSMLKAVLRVVDRGEHEDYQMVVKRRPS